MRLQTRLALLFGAVVIAAAGLIGALGYLAMAEQLGAQVDQSLLDVSEPLSQRLAAGRLGGELFEDRPDGGGGPEHGPSTTNLVLPTQVLLPSGTVVSGSNSEVVLPADEADQAIAASSTPTVAFRNVQIDGQAYRMVTQSAGGANGAIQVGRDIGENLAVLHGLARRMAVIGVAVAALAALAGWAVARRASRRLERLAAAAEEVTATGRLEVEVPTTGSDEIARLGRAFETMLVRLGQARADQQRLVQDAGHELRTPLTSLRTNVHLLSRFDALPPATRERVIADLDGETRELTHLVDEVVQLAGSTPTDVPDDVIALVGPATAAVDRARRRTGRDIRLSADDSLVLAHAALLERAIWNLVDNACKFSPADTPVEVLVANGTVTVSDRGPGIDQADLPHVFDRFYRAADARSQPGSGLGLAIVHDIVTARGGRVMAANRPGGGTQIGFWLPPGR